MKVKRNSFYHTIRPLAAWLDTGEIRPTNVYFGSSRMHTRIYKKVTLPSETSLQFLHGGNFILENGKRIPVRFTPPEEPTLCKNHNYDFNRIDGLSAEDVQWDRGEF